MAATTRGTMSARPGPVTSDATERSARMDHDTRKGGPPPLTTDDAVRVSARMRST